MTRPRIFILTAGAITILIALTSDNFTLIVTAAIIFLIALAHYLTVTPLGHDTNDHGPTIHIPDRTQWRTTANYFTVTDDTVLERPNTPYNQDDED